MPTKLNPQSASIIRLKFTKERPTYGFGGISEWATTHQGREYKLVKDLKAGSWLLYVLNNDRQERPMWELVPVAKNDYAFGTRLDDAKHNASILLRLGQGPDHQNWRD